MFGQDDSIRVSKRSLRIACGVAAAIASLVAVSLGADSASAKTYRANLLADPTPNGCKAGKCSLREAVIAANQTPGFDSIVLRPGKYRLALAGSNEDLAATGDLDVTAPLAISTPPLRRAATIDARGIDRIFDLADPLTLRRLVLRNGNAAGDVGGAIRANAAAAALRAVDVRFLSNRASDGGAVANASFLGRRFEFVRVLFRGNLAVQHGGAISMVFLNPPEAPHPVTFRRVKALSNRAGGLGGFASLAAPVTRVVRSRVASNTSGASGGGIYVEDGPLTVVKSTIASNRTGSGGDGGGVFSAGGSPTATTTIRESTISANHASGDGGGVKNSGATTNVVNSTIANNRADESGGGVGGTAGTTSLNAVTVARNRANADGSGGEAGGGIYAVSSFAVANSLIALNTVGTGSSDPSCSGTISSGGANLLTSDDAGCSGFALGAADLLRTNPRIGALGNHGGPTRTIPLQAGSPAINKAGATAPNRDQRGRRKTDRRDIGAFEFKPGR